MQYIGNVAFEETPDSGSVTVDAWGADVVTLVYQGAMNLAEAFATRLGHRRDKPHPTYRQCFMTGWDFTAGRAFGTFSVKYRGLRFSQTPQPIVSTGLRREQIVLPYLLGTDNVSASRGAQTQLTYLAPYSTYKYLRRSRPTERQFAGKLETFKDSLRVIARTGGQGPVTLTPDKLTTGNVGAYNGIIRLEPVEFTCEPDGLWWNCTETNQIFIYPTDLSNDANVYDVTTITTSL